MIDPVSIAAVSGISTLGGILLGKLGKKNKTKENIDIPESILTNIPTNEIQFLRVTESVDPKLILDYVFQGKSVFVSTAGLRKSILKPFLDALAEAAKLENLRINHVASDMIFITTLEQEVLIDTVTSQSNSARKLEIDDIVGS